MTPRARHARDEPLDGLDAGALRIDVVGRDRAAVQDDDAVDHLEDVVDVVGDEDARVAGVAGVAHEPQHALRLRHAQVVGGLVEDDEVAVEVHRPAMATDCRSPPESEAIGVVAGMFLLMPTRRSSSPAMRFMVSWSMRFRNRGPSAARGRGTCCARSRAG
jgi:hypothetical protein